jgi:hypothetical protein
VRALPGATLFALLLVGCSVERLPVSVSPPPSQSPETSIRRSPPPSAAATPEPTLLVAEPIFPPVPWPKAVIPDGRLVRTASARVDDVDVRITLDANPLVAGEPAWITTELTNLGRDKLYWYGPGCGIDVLVTGRLPDLRWRVGAEQPGIAGEFKKAALWDARVTEDRSVDLDFVPEWAVGIGEFACGDIAIREELRPGRRFRDRMQWDGSLFQGAGFPPTSVADITGTFGPGWNRASDGPNRRRAPIEVHLPAWIQGIEAPVSLSVGEAVDVALTHDAFAEWVKERFTSRDRWQFVTNLDPATGVWQIGLAQYPGGDTRIVVVDSATGRPTAYLKATIDGAGKLRDVGPAN